MNVLFTCAGRRNYLLNYFKDAIAPHGKIIAADSDYTASAFSDADVGIEVPSLKSSNYLDAIKDIIIDYKVALVIPLNDLELSLMAKNKIELESTGAKVIVSNTAVINMCNDKWQTYEFLTRLGVPTPLSFLKLELLLQAIEANKLNYPVILKPRWGCGSINIEIANNEYELYSLFKSLKTRLKSAPFQGAHKNSSDDTILLQEKIDGQEYGVDIVNDFNGNYYGSFARKKLAMRSGETERAVSVVNERLSEIGQQVARATGHIGIMDCDFFVKEDKVYLLEMNPRFGGGYPFSHEAGINLPEIYIAWLKGFQNVAKFDNYKADVITSKCDRIVRIKEKERPEFQNNNVELNEFSSL
ncbi:MAG: ATP-grasp domain-containing protein [Pricia sp.]|nr:ATP-grasp domain-containing protein [Pricia sp.]